MRFRFVTLTVLVAILSAPLAGAQERSPTNGWLAATPVSMDLDPAPLDALDRDIASGKHGYVDAMLIIRRGKVVYDRSYRHDYDRIYGELAKIKGPLNPDPKGQFNYYNPDWHPFYRRGDLHSMQSVTKTVTSILIGIATSRKEFSDLDTPVLRFFDTAKVANIDDRKRRLTLRHLLTMTAGLDWNEDLPHSDPKNTAMLMEASDDWVRFAINRPMAHEPGTVFAYSSGASALLSHVFKKETGKDIEEYAQKQLFKPLGIKRHYWKRTPTGLSDTEGGLYLTPHDLAKIGYLYLKNGVWGGKQILQADWIKASVAPSVSEARGGMKYGYKWWLFPYGNAPERLAWTALGFGGQRLIVLPEHDLVLVFTGWNIDPNRPRNIRESLDPILRATGQQVPVSPPR
jgi:CubicO group peptidase (beta-lactamase class C family)